MLTASTNPSPEEQIPFAGVGVPCAKETSTASSISADHPAQEQSSKKSSQGNALQALLAFSALLEQVRRRKSPASRESGFAAAIPVADVQEREQFELDEVLQLVAERALAITCAGGLAIALADNGEIVLRAAAGTVRPDLGARIDRDSAFSGACFRTAVIMSCDDTETDARVNLQACRRMGARSMVAVPLCGQRRGIGLLQAFSSEPFGFDDHDVRNLSFLADLLVRALTPEEEHRFAESAQAAATKLEAPSAPEAASAAILPPQVARAELPQAPLVDAVRQTLEAEISSPPTAAILHEPAPEAEKSSEYELAIECKPTGANEGAIELALLPVEWDGPTLRSRMLLLLMCIVVAMVAGVAWWKLKTAHLGSVMLSPAKEDLQLQGHVPKMRIVIDAGHGGRDLGTVGRDGLLEKNLALEIGQRLGKLLEERLGMDVIYTRQDDTYVPLEERAKIANQAKADLFVSVHANYGDLPSARGAETYYTNFVAPPNSQNSNTLRNASATGNVVTASLSPPGVRERIEQSRRLAASVQRSLYETLSVQNPGLRDRGIKEAGFVVLTESAMPGILAEVSFVSSPADEQKLRSDGYREQVAEALYQGIARYAAGSPGIEVSGGQGYFARAKAVIWDILATAGTEFTKVREHFASDLASLPPPAMAPKKNCSYPGEDPNGQCVPAHGLAASRAATTYEEASTKSQGHPVSLTTKAQVSAAAMASPATHTDGVLLDQRIAQLPREFRSALEDEVYGILSSNCQQINSAAPVYNCPCFYRKSVTAQLDQGAILVQGRAGVSVNPPLALILPDADVHECINQSILSKYGYQRAMQMMGDDPSDKSRSISQCVGNRVSAEYAAKPGPNIRYIDGLTATAYAACSSR